MNRRSGVSKINKREAVSALGTLLRLGVSRALGGTRMPARSDVGAMAGSTQDQPASNSRTVT